MVLTEVKLKELYNKEKFKIFFLEKGTILTPSARQFLTDKKIEIVKDKEKFNQKQEEVKDKDIEKEVEIVEKEKIVEVEKKPRYFGLAGEAYFEKPEHMTQIYGNVLVKKDDDRIIFRGKLDTFLSSWLIFAKESKSYESKALDTDIASITIFLKELLKAEVLDTVLPNMQVLGESLEKIKEISHNPKKYFDSNHLFNIDVENSILVLKLNELRAKVRELEIYGIKAFIDDKGKVEHREIIQALNRLSSAIYVMMLKGEKEKY